MPTPQQFTAQRPQAIYAQQTNLPYQQRPNNLMYSLSNIMQLATAAQSLFGQDPRSKLLSAQASAAETADKSAILEMLTKTNPEERGSIKDALIASDKKKYGWLNDIGDITNVGEDDQISKYKHQDTRSMYEQSGGQSGVPMEQGQAPPAEAAPSSGAFGDLNEAPPEMVVPSAPFTSGTGMDGAGTSLQQPQQMMTGTGVDGADTPMPSPLRQMEAERGMPEGSMYQSQDGSAYVKLSDFDKKRHPPAALLNIPPKGPEDPLINEVSQAVAPTAQKMVPMLNLTSRLNAMNAIQRGVPIQNSDSLLLSLNNAEIDQVQKEMAAQVGVQDPAMVDPVYGMLISKIRRGDEKDLAALRQDPVYGVLLEKFNSMPPTLRKFHYDQAGIYDKMQLEMDTLAAKKMHWVQTYEVDKTKAQASLISSQASLANAGANLTRAQTEASKWSDGSDGKPVGAEYAKAQANTDKLLADAYETRLKMKSFPAEQSLKFAKLTSEIAANRQSALKHAAEVEKLLEERGSADYAKVVKQQEIAARSAGQLQTTLAGLQMQKAEILSKLSDPVTQAMAANAVDRLEGPAKEEYIKAQDVLEPLDATITKLTEAQTADTVRKGELDRLEKTLYTRDVFFKDWDRYGYAQYFAANPAEAKTQAVNGLAQKLNTSGTPFAKLPPEEKQRLLQAASEIVDMAVQRSHKKR